MRSSQRYDYRLMNESTLGFVDPYKMAAQKQTMQGNVAIVSMPRASKMLASEEGVVSYKLVFYTDDHLCVIAGELKSILTMRCHRCLQAFADEVESSFRVSPVKGDSEAKKLADGYDPVIVPDVKLYPSELIEDELILAMPIVPMHKDLNECVDCTVIMGQSTKDKVQEMENPFQILQTLKVNKTDQQIEDK